MTVKIEDVARAAGVSTATVSRALRDLPSVSPGTRSRVRRAAVELGYVVSRSASTLASGRTRTVAVVTPYASRWFFASMIEAVERTLQARGYDVLLVTVEPVPTPGRVTFEPESLRGRVDGVIVLTAPVTGTELDGLRRLRMPTVFIGAAVPGSMSVRIDDVAVGRLATEHLVALGHRRIAHIGGDPREALSFSAPADRRAGWMSSLRHHGIHRVAGYDVPGCFTASGGRAAMERLLRLGGPPTAVFAASDEMALGALAAAGFAGLRVPEDLSVVGVDGHDLADVFDLTTVEQPVERQGATAADLVLAALGGNEDRLHEHDLLPVRLVARGSSAAPRQREAS